MDGDIDYSKFSRIDLVEALTRIDKQRYPKNYANLLKEVGARPPAVPTERHSRDLSKWVMWIGWYQLAASLIFVHTLLLSVSPATWIISWMAIALLGLAALTATAGVFTVRGHRLGPYLSILSFASQVVSLTVPGFAYQYAPLLAVYVSWTSATMGVTGLIGPDSKIRVGDTDPTYLAIDALAVVALVVLVTYVRRRDIAS
jgi:hypothetical protein